MSLHTLFARIARAALLTTAATVASTAAASNVTGDPLADGWNLAGNALANGHYSRGSANYAFNMYSSTMQVTSGSNLNISAGAHSWNVGDTVLGVGGRFQTITAAEGDWTDIVGNGVNSLLTTSSAVKIQAKFGTSAGIWSTSTTNPNGGNGLASLSDGGLGAVQIRSSGSNGASYWATNSGTLMSLQSAGHITRNGGSAPDAAVARMIWQYDSLTGKPISWQLLLNTTLMSQLVGGDLPSSNIFAIMTIQNGDGEYTDGLINVPGPGVLAMFGLGGIITSQRRRRN